MSKTINKETIDKMLKKLTQPIHINYIASYLLRVELSEARQVIEVLIDEDVIEKSNYANDYYQLKQK